MACRLFGIKPLPETILTLCHLNPWKRTSVKLKLKYNHFLLTKCIWSCLLNGGHFCCTLNMLAVLWNIGSIGISVTLVRNTYMYEANIGPWCVVLRLSWPAMHNIYLTGYRPSIWRQRANFDAIFNGVSHNHLTPNCRLRCHNLWTATPWFDTKYLTYFTIIFSFGILPNGDLFLIGHHCRTSTLVEGMVGFAEFVFTTNVNSLWPGDVDIGQHWIR